MDWKVGKSMEYRISNICSDLGIGKSTIYKRIDILKQTIPESDWKQNDYFYYTEDNKLFFTDKGYSYIKEFKNNSKKVQQDSTQKDVALYQAQIIDIYKQRIEYLENENKRLLDIISVKEQKELAKDIKYIGNSDTMSFWDKLFNKFKK